MWLILLAVFCFSVAIYATILDSIKYAHVLKDGFNARKQEINWYNLFGLEFWLFVALNIVCGFMAWPLHAVGSAYFALAFIVALIFGLCVFYRHTVRWYFLSRWIFAAGFFGAGAWVAWDAKPVLAAIFYVLISFIIINTVSRFICIFSKE